MRHLFFVFLSLALVSCTREGNTPEPSAIKTVTSTSTATATEVATQPAHQLDCKTVLKGIEASCPKPGEFQAADLATYTDKRFLDVATCMGWETIIRYYDWKQESIKGKTPTAAELKLIKDSGRKFMAVFQHYNSSPSTFTKARGEIDAKRVLELAGLWGQPKGSAAYFGVDTDEAKLSAVLEYFKAATPIIRAAGYRVGMYGNGTNCKELKKAKLIDGDLCWIAASSWGWSGTKQILAEGKGYALAQKVNQKCGGKSLDYNKVLVKDFGQWSIP